ncbi:unnamed protein product [Rhizoctonia solani]|uniref:Uncharacterized protein n=1 Tax=Rhizoctonia solani TaxID=456999 RepID=A0A8H3DEQ2_9AGAM|nr:unnamed protein product [Rhizoctonia solani]
MEPTTSTVPDPKATIELAVYTTKRRLVINGASASSNAQWRPHYSLSLGTETLGGVLGTVCYYDDNDISGMTIEVGTMPVVLQKLQCDSKNAEMDYTFVITLEGTGDTESRFRGSLNDHEGEWEWEGRYAGMRTHSRGGQSEETYGPDGSSSLQVLLSYPSLSVQGNNLALQEASHIFGRILLASIPRDVRIALQLNIQPLDPEEEHIRSLARDFLSWAAVVALFKHWYQSESVDQGQRDRIDIHRCEQFYPACAAYHVPTIGVDPVGESGWDRREDANVIRSVQEQYRRVGLECYQLGYRRKVTWLQSFLDHPAYWYKRLAYYLSEALINYA